MSNDTHRTRTSIQYGRHRLMIVTTSGLVLSFTLGLFIGYGIQRPNQNKAKEPPKPNNAKEQPNEKYVIDRRNNKECRSQLEWVGQAFENYRGICKSFPPASVYDAHGRPMHSWRVLLVPFLEASKFYVHYDLEEPWDGPNNRRLKQEFYDQKFSDRPLIDITRVRHWFQCPSAPSQNNFCTNYVMVVDQREPLVPFQGGGLNAELDWQARRSPGGEIMIVEIHNSDIHWMEPRDLSLEEMSFLINDPNKPSISSGHVGGAFVLKKDGTVEFLDNGTTEERLRTMLKGKDGATGR